MKKILSFLLFNSFLIVLHGQFVNSITGGNANSNQGSVSYTVGSILYNTVSGINGIITYGVQQPMVAIITVIENTNEITLNVYPNPTNALIKLVVSDKNLNFLLYNMNGVLLQDKKIESSETEISLINFSSSIYFLKVIKNNHVIKVFKIVKK